MQNIEKMNLEEINSIFYYGNDIIEEITKRSMDIDRSTQDNSYIFTDDFKKLIERVTTFSENDDKELKKAAKEQDVDNSVEDKIIKAVVGELFKPLSMLFNKEKNKEEKEENVKKIQIGTIKEQKYKELDLLQKELEELSYAICEKIAKTEQAEEELQQYADILNNLYQNGRQQLEDFKIEISELENIKSNDEVQESIKNSKLNMYKRNYNQAIKKIDSISKVYVSFMNNKENRNNIIHNNQVQIFIIDEILHETIPVLNNHISVGVDIMHAKKTNEMLKEITLKANKCIKDSSNSLSKSITEANDLYINGGISQETQKLVSQNNINNQKQMAQLEEKKVAHAIKNIEANNLLLENIEANKALGSGNEKTLKYLPQNNSHN